MANSPRYVTYINALMSWWPPTAIAAGMGVPGYAPVSAYNVINIAFWTSNAGPVDAGLVWAHPINYVSTDNPWGQTDEAVRAAWLAAYHASNISVAISAFGATDFPTSQGANPEQVATSLAQFVIDTNLDGVDLDYEDNDAMNAGKGEDWVIRCTTKLRSLLPANKFITHAPQAPYFMGSPQYVSGGYVTVNTQVGRYIDWYNVQFYNQGDSAYDTYTTLFVQSNGWAVQTSVSEIAKKCGNNATTLQKIVVGKPVTAGDASNTGYVATSTLAGFLSQAKSSLGWCGGVMGWQYSSDMQRTGNTWINTLAASLGKSC